MKILWCGAGLLVAAAAACGGSDGTGDGTFVPDAGGSSSSGASSGASGRDGGSSGASGSNGSSGATSSSSSGDAGTDGGSSGAGSSSGGSSGLPPECAEGAEPGADLGVVLELGTPAPSSVTVAEDGLTVAWVTEADGNVVVHVTDRAGFDVPFGAPLTLSGAFANERVALGRDGLVLAVTNVDHHGFLAYERMARGTPFAVAAQSPFDNVNELGALGAESGASLGDPLYANNQGYFVFSQYGGGLTNTLRLGSRPMISKVYSGGEAFTDVVFLNAVGADRRQPIALSADQRSLFYYDQVDDQAYVTSRDDQAGTFAAPTSLGARLDARPIDGCGTLVFRDPATPTQLRAVAYE